MKRRGNGTKNRGAVSINQKENTRIGKEVQRRRSEILATQTYTQTPTQNALLGEKEREGNLHIRLILPLLIPCIILFPAPYRASHSMTGGKSTPGRHAAVKEEEEEGEDAFLTDASSPTKSAKMKFNFQITAPGREGM